MTATGVAANSRNAGVIEQKDTSSNGVACDLNFDATDTRELAIMHATTAADGGTELISTAFNWSTGTKYTLKLTRDGTNYTWATGATSTTTTSALTATPAEVGFYISNASARFEYLFVVTSP